MQFFVKTEVVDGKVDELAQRMVRREFKPIRGNLVFCSEDGRFGYNLIEADSLDEVRQQFQNYRGYITVLEITPVMSVGQFIERWKCAHGIHAAPVMMPGGGQPSVGG